MGQDDSVIDDTDDNEDFYNNRDEDVYDNDVDQADQADDENRKLPHKKVQ